ncbi:hypothetical protein AAC387_Pa07g3232 [Persea americana]
MGCFSGCFSVKGKDRPPDNVGSNTVSSRSREPAVSRNRLSSLLLLEEESSQSRDEEHDALQPTSNTVKGDADDGELKEKAKFSTSLGTLFQSSAEIQNTSQKFKVLSHDGDDAYSKFHSRLHVTSGKKLNQVEQSDRVSISKNKFDEELGRLPMPKNSVSRQPTSCCSSIPEGQQQSMTSRVMFTRESAFEYVETEMGIPIRCNTYNASPAATPKLPVETMQCKKCVRFQCDTAHNADMDLVSLSSSTSKLESNNCNLHDSLSKDVGEGQLFGPKHSPYPTLVKLTDEMQSPGSVHPTKLENFAGGRNARIRSQYVYPVLNPVENSSQWNALKKEFDTHQVDHPGESFDQCRKACCESTKTPMKSFKDNADGIEQNRNSPMPVVESLSDWLKPVTSNDIKNRRTISNGKSYSGKSTDDDRPIVGSVAAHWNDDEPSHIPPKQWDGNGIPNSTTKYKEDQKVSWHATPFEERLEKALSDERLFPQRNPMTGKPIDFDESEESDTAASNFQTSHHQQSCVKV